MPMPMPIPLLGTVAKGLAGLALVSLATTAGLLYRYQRLLIYPSNVPPGSRQHCMAPDELGMPYAEEELRTPDGETVRLFLILQDGSVERTLHEPRSVGAAAAARRPTVLILHANAGNMGHRLPLAKVFYRRFAFNVVMLSYRGYGLSTGAPSEAGIRADAHATLAFLRAHPTLSKTVLLVYGQSLGGAVAIDLASTFPEQVEAAILENTFTSIPDLIPHVLPPLRPFAFLCREVWPSKEAITKVKKSLPVLFLSGRDDELVPPAQMDALFHACPARHKHFVPIAGGMHNDTCAQPGYFDHIGTFIKQHIIPLAKERALPGSRISGSTAPSHGSGSGAGSSSGNISSSPSTDTEGQAYPDAPSPGSALSSAPLPGTTSTAQTHGKEGSAHAHPELRKRLPASASTTPDELTGDEGEWVKMSADDAASKL